VFRIDRYIFREVGTPALLGVFLFLTVLLVNSFFKLAELAVQHSVPLPIILRLLLYLLPTLLTMTIPMAVLLGVLVGLSSLSARSELVALKACGVSDLRLLGPVILVGLMGAAASAWLYLVLVPLWNQAHVDLRLEIARTADITSVVKPRVFYEGLPGLVLYADDVSADGRTLHHLFLYREASPPQRPEEEVYLAPKALLDKGADGKIRIELHDGTQHRMGEDPSAYETVRFQKYLLTQDPARKAAHAGLVRSSKGPRQMNLRELHRALDLADEHRSEVVRERRRRLFQVEIQKRFALPLAAVVFALLAFPLGGSIKRGGRASGFAISLGIILAYWVIISYGEDRAIQGGISPWLGVWLPNVIFLGLALLLYLFAGTERREVPGLRRLTPALAVLTSRLRGWLSPLLLHLPRRLPVPLRKPAQRGVFGLRPSLLDRYVLGTYLRSLFLIFGGLYLVYIVGDYFLSKAKHVHQNDISWGTVADYYRFLTPQVVQYVLPLSAMVAALVAFGLLASSNEIRAMVCSGTSVYRIVVPVIIAAALLSVLSYWINDYVLPYANRRAEELENKIEGRSPRSHYRPDRRWVFGEDGRLYHYMRLDEIRGRFIRLEVLDLDPLFHLERRTFAPFASWDGSGWALNEGWTRSFAEGNQEFETFTERRFPWPEPPDYFSATTKPPDEMRFNEYARYIDELATSGYETRGMRAELWNKISFPSVTLILVIMGLPFSFRMERKGALYGVGLALGLAMVYYTMMAVFTALGKAELLPPLLAAFAPNLLFLGAGLYMLLNVKT